MCLAKVAGEKIKTEPPGLVLETLNSQSVHLAEENIYIF